MGFFLPPPPATTTSPFQCTHEAVGYSRPAHTPAPPRAGWWWWRDRRGWWHSPSSHSGREWLPLLQRQSDRSCLIHTDTAWPVLLCLCISNIHNKKCSICVWVCKRVRERESAKKEENTGGWCTADTVVSQRWQKESFLQHWLLWLSAFVWLSMAWN